MTPDDILKIGKKPAITAPTPAVDSSLAGAPETMPGSASSVDKTKMTGSPVQSAKLPPSVSPDVAGAPKANEAVINPTVEKSTETVKETTTEGSEAPKEEGFYTRWFREHSTYKPPTPEVLEKERKKRKRDSIFSAIGDGISAMSNLYFTTQYAPDSFDASKGLAPRAKARFDKLKKEREANQREYMEGYMRAMRMDDEVAFRDKQWEHTVQRERVSDERQKAKDDLENALAELEAKYKEHKISEAAYNAATAKVKAEHAEKVAKLEEDDLAAGIEKKKAGARASNASATASYARADYYGSKKGGKEFPTLYLEDESMEFDNDDDFEKTVLRLAPDYMVPVTQTIVTERETMGSSKGMPKKTKEVRRPTIQIAADIERIAASRKKARSSRGKGYGQNKTKGKGKGY